ncbi:zinc finger protein, putative [Bodo saltans]|uniref:Zinc finger protein, putative n=1 Tax=Bodo saltans TaxID=75058 RepID=A0A0S4JCR3_BODSA|nr:zinc finger protein, putative [Bodo saltans]|eukprot:CUG89341.1 zinc finger protein, putative [Bodo saltans]
MRRILRPNDDSKITFVGPDNADNELHNEKQEFADDNKIYVEPCAACSFLLSREAMLSCPCGFVVYCGTGCQTKHWPDHKSRCSAAMKQKTVQICAYCRRTSTSLHTCRCGQTYYCTQNCQRKHWVRHAHMCATSRSSSLAHRMSSSNHSSNNNNGHCFLPRTADKAVQATGDPHFTHKTQQLTIATAAVASHYEEDGPNDKSMVTGLLSQGSPKVVFAPEENIALTSTASALVVSMGDDAESDDFSIDLSNEVETSHQSRLQDLVPRGSGEKKPEHHNHDRRSVAGTFTTIKYSAKNRRAIDASSLALVTNPLLAPQSTHVDDDTAPLDTDGCAVVGPQQAANLNLREKPQLARVHSLKLSAAELKKLNTIAVAVYYDLRDPWALVPCGGRMDQQDELRPRKVTRGAALIVQK